MSSQGKHEALRLSARIAIAVLAAILLATGLFVITQRHVTTPITRREALRRFRTARAHEDAALADAPPATTSSTVVASGGGDRSSVLPRVKTASPVTPSPGVDRPQAPRAPGPYTLPAEGVYAYRTSGGESTSVASHTYPSETYASVTHSGGCEWKNEFDVAQEDVDTTTRCSDPGHLLQLEDQRAITFFGQTESEDLRCDPPLAIHDLSESPGTTLSGVCHSSDTTAEVQTTFVGHETVAVGNASVDAVHLSAHAVLKGRANGTADEQMWLLPQTGLPLRLDRAEDADARAFGTSIRYHERATFVLDSLTPST